MEHGKYWSQYPGKYDHTRFSDGFLQGWDDAWLFYSNVNAMPKGATVPELGFRGPWVKARAHEYGKEKGTKNIWEFGASYPLHVPCLTTDLRWQNTASCRAC